MLLLLLNPQFFREMLDQTKFAKVDLTVNLKISRRLGDSRINVKGECQMRTGIGTAMIILIIALVGLGYSIYGYIDTSEQLDVMSQRGRTAYRWKIRPCKSKSIVLMWKSDNLNAQVSDPTQQVQQSKEENRTLGEKNDELAGENSTSKERNLALEEQINQMNSRNTIDAGLLDTNSAPASLGLIILALPVAVGTTYLVARRQAMSSIPEELGNALEQHAAGYHGQAL